MPSSLTFIHSGDLHLGAPFRGLRNLSDRWASRLVRAIPEAYEKLIDACIDNNVDFLLLAGDIFDTDQPSYAHYRTFLDGLERLRDAGIEVYLCAGNHDPYPSWQNSFVTLPDNTHLFPSDHPEFMVHRRNGEPVAIIGCRGFSNQAHDGGIAAGITRDAALRACGVEAPFAIGMLHSGLQFDTDKAPVKESELRAAHMDYWALGHIHRPYVDDESDPRIVYSGCIQGRDIKEMGERGCFKVTLDEGLPPHLDFIPTASVEWQRIDVDVSGLAGTNDIVRGCVSAMFEANHSTCEEMVARISLTGCTPLHEALAHRETLEDMRIHLNDKYPGSFFCDALEDCTSAVVDKQALRREGMFPATLMERADAADRDPDSVVSYLQKEFAERDEVLPELIRFKVPGLVKRAEDIVLDLLGGELR